MAVPDVRSLAVLHPGTEVRSHDLDVVITPDLVADLYDPTLVISHGYVGPERRGSDRSHGGRHAPTWTRRTLSVVLLTAAVVVPLTLIAARSVPPAASGRAPAPAAGPSASTSGAVHRGTRAPGATSRQIARAQAVHRRAMARAGAAGTPAGGGPTGTAATRFAGVGASAPIGVAPSGPSTAPQRAAAAAAAAQARADAQLAAATRRQARAAARVEAQAARAADQAARAAAQAARRGAGASGATGTSHGATAPGT